MLPFQEPSLWDRFPQLDPLACMAALHLVAGRRIYSGGGAVREVVRRLPLTRPLASIWRLPGMPAFMERLYQLIAGHRHMLGCNSAACNLSAHAGSGAGPHSR